MLGPSGGKTPSALLFATIKVAAVVGFLSLVAANWLATGGLDQTGLARLAAETTAGRKEPTTTGSLAATSLKLDPCTGRTKP